MWNQPLHDMDFVKQVLATVTPEKYRTAERMTGMLSVVAEELPDRPLYFSLASLCATLHCTTPSQVQVRSALMHLGYRVSISHANPLALKTDAPTSVVWDVMRAWVKLNPVKNIKDGAPGATILARDIATPDISFEAHPDAIPQSRKQGISRFPDNPEPNWGPKARAKRKRADGHEDTETLEAKSIRLQGHRTKKKPRSDFPCRYFAKVRIKGPSWAKGTWNK